MTITWARHNENGYEVSSRGDQRFSPLFATMPDGRTIEAHYHCDVKGFEPGGTAWRRYKGKRPAGKTEDQLLNGFCTLWWEWASHHPAEMAELAILAERHNNVLTDRFAATNVNQAHALSRVLNVMHERGYRAKQDRFGRYLWRRYSEQILP